MIDEPFDRTKPCGIAIDISICWEDGAYCLYDMSSYSCIRLSLEDLQDLARYAASAEEAEMRKKERAT